MPKELRNLLDSALVKVIDALTPPSNLEEANAISEAIQARAALARYREA